MAKIIDLTKGFKALVDDEDFDRLAAYKWCALPDAWNVYAVRHFSEGGKAKTVWMHREILGVDMFVDHKNRNGLDNRRANLRPATCTQNQANKRIQRNNTSGFKGVSFDKSRGLWMAAIRNGGRRQHIGRFADVNDAARAYDERAIEIFGEFALTNQMLREMGNR